MARLLLIGVEPLQRLRRRVSELNPCGRNPVGAVFVGVES